MSEPALSTRGFRLRRLDWAGGRRRRGANDVNMDEFVDQFLVDIRCTARI